MSEKCEGCPIVPVVHIGAVGAGKCGRTTCHLTERDFSIIKAMIAGGCDSKVISRWPNGKPLQIFLYPKEDGDEGFVRRDD